VKSNETVDSALSADLDRLGLSQAELAAKLKPRKGKLLTEQAISMWRNRNTIPPKRVKELAVIFGRQSELMRHLGYNTDSDSFVQRLESAKAIEVATPVSTVRGGEHKTLLDVSAREIEKAIEVALSNLLGTVCVVKLELIDFALLGKAPTSPVPMSLTIQHSD
jgi:hypothetical protein